MRRRWETAVLAALLVVGFLATPGRALADGGCPEADPDPPDGPTLIFVHGWQAAFNDAGFDLLLDCLDSNFPDRVVPFVYFQDAGFVNGEACTSEGGPMAAPSPETPPSPAIPMPVIATGSDLGTCDSLSDIGLNVVALSDMVKDIYTTTEQPVVLVSNSMGTPIVRGLMSYSSDLGDGVIDTMVDSIVYLEGLHDGTSWVRTGENDIGIFQGGCANDPATCLLGDRPAVHEVADQSDWFQWANPGPTRYVDLPTFNVYGDLALQAETCFLWFCHELGDPEEHGDFAVMPGTDDPFDVPAGGGARLLLDSSIGDQRWQWAIHDELAYVLDGPGAVVAANAALYNHPASHGNFKFNLDTIEVEDCKTHATVSVREGLWHVIIGRMNGTPYFCDYPHG